MADYLAAPTPFAFWRKRSGKTQASLAAEAGVSQPFLAQIEAGVRIDDLVETAGS
jgi:transcriptional regulator with XRE-family HTH domain